MLTTDWLNLSEKDYFEHRLNNQINWYSTKADSNKRYHTWSKVFIIILSTSIPVIAGIDFNGTCKNILLAVIGGVVSVLSGLSGLMKYQENWTEFRTTSETLKHEKTLYLTKAGHYNNPELSQSEHFKELVTRVENLISKEHSAWSQYINQHSST